MPPPPLSAHHINVTPHRSVIPSHDGISTGVQEAGCRYKNGMTKQRAFSLVELSIVLVILGLLTGGILTGQSLIRSAEMRKITLAHERYRMAIFTFRDKYFALPSDMPNATRFWGAKTATSCTNNPGVPVNAADGTCDGNGDGFVYNDGNGEFKRVFEQLSLAGLVEGTYRHSVVPPLNETQALGVEFPAIGVGKAGARFSYIGVVNGVNMHPSSLHGNTGNFLRIGAPSPYSTGLVEGIVKPEEAYNIDMKIDDGRPGTGAFLAHYDASDPDVLTTRCVNNFNSPNAVYNLTFTNNGCTLWFRIN